jgi:hypothetical protein
MIEIPAIFILSVITCYFIAVYAKKKIIRHINLFHSSLNEIKNRQQLSEEYVNVIIDGFNNSFSQIKKEIKKFKSFDFAFTQVNDLFSEISEFVTINERLFFIEFEIYFKHYIQDVLRKGIVNIKIDVFDTKIIFLKNVLERKLKIYFGDGFYKVCRLKIDKEINKLQTECEQIIKENLNSKNDAFTNINLVFLRGFIRIIIKERIEYKSTYKVDKSKYIDLLKENKIENLIENLLIDFENEEDRINSLTIISGNYYNLKDREIKGLRVETWERPAILEALNNLIK